MSIFRERKPVITKEIKEGTALFRVGYGKLKSAEIYKAGLMRELIGGGVCLAVVNSRFMYKEQKNRYDDGRQELLERLESLSACFLRLGIKRKAEMSFFGISIRQGDGKLYQDHIIGIVFEAAEVDDLLHALKGYNINYYTGRSIVGKAELLELFQASPDDEEKLRASFRYTVFDDSFMGSLVIYCSEEDADNLDRKLRQQ